MPEPDPSPPAPLADVADTDVLDVDAAAEDAAAEDATEPAAPEPPVADACPNCGAPRTGPFCQGCGQHYLDERLTLRVLWREASSRVFNLDRGLLHTLSRLAGGPGRVPDDYVAGRRRRYTHPLSFYLLTATVYLLSGALYQSVAIEASRDAPLIIYQAPDAPADSLDTAADSLAEAGTGERLQAVFEEINGDGTGIARRAVQIQRRIGTPMLVFFALFLVLPLRLAFGPKRTLAETTVFSLYVVGFATLVMSLVAPLLYLTLDLVVASVLLTVLTFGTYAGLSAWGATTFWQPGWATVFKAAFACIVGYVVYAIASGFVAIVILLSEILETAEMGWRELLSL